jgi:putative peptidoglycan lipid II flippase
LLFWKRIGLKFRLNFGWRGVGLRPAAKAASWTLGMVLVTQAGGLVQSIVASSTITARETGGLAVASVAAASIGWLVFMLPRSIATVSIATASFTKISQHAHDGDIDALKRDLGASLRAILAISAFAAATLTVLAYPIARVFVGEYEATIALGNVIMAMMVGLVSFSFVFMLQRAFYALEDTRTPFFFTLAQISVFVVGALIIAQTVPAVWLVAALSLLNSVSITVQAVLAYRLLRRRIGRFEGVGLAKAATRMIAAGIVAGVAGWAFIHYTGLVAQGGYGLGTVLGAVLTCVPTGLIMLLVYFVVLALLGVEETWKAWQGVAKAFKGIARR